MKAAEEALQLIDIVSLSVLHEWPYKYIRR